MRLSLENGLALQIIQMKTAGLAGNQQTGSARLSLLIRMPGLVLLSTFLRVAEHTFMITGRRKLILSMKQITMVLFQEQSLIKLTN